MIGSCAVISNSAAARLQKSKIEIKRKIVRVDRPNPLLMVTFSQTPQFQDDFTKSFVQMWDNANLLHFISTQIVSMARFYCRNNRKKCNYSIQKGWDPAWQKDFCNLAAQPPLSSLDGWYIFCETTWNLPSMQFN